MTITYSINEKVEMPAKHPATSRLYTVNMATAVSGLNDGSSSDTGFLQGRTIASISVGTPSPSGGLTIAASANDTKTFTLTTGANGDDGKDYEIDVLVTLSTGLVENVTIFIPVRDPGNN